MIPSLRSGHVRLRSKYLPNGTAMNTTMQHIHCTMEDAKYANPACQAYVYGSRYGFRLPTDAAQAFSNVSEYARVLRFYLGKQILEHFAPKANRTALDDETLVVYLRSGDTILIPFAGGVTRVEARSLLRQAGLPSAKLVECHGSLSTARCRGCRKTCAATQSLHSGWLLQDFCRGPDRNHSGSQSQYLAYASGLLANLLI